MKNILFALLIAIGGTNVSLGQCSPSVMEAFGGTSSIALYNTYVSIGAIADGYTAETYDSGRVQSLMNEQTSMLGTVTTLLGTAIADKSGSLSDDDRAYLVEMKTCFIYLQRQAQGLHDFAATGSEEANTAYDYNRTLAWEAIESLLGLDKE